jgi:diguanylate cyclase (GGDEF)-like protein
MKGFPRGAAVASRGGSPHRHREVSNVDHEAPRPRARHLPVRAIALSLLALSAPVLGSFLAPAWVSQESGVLLWLSALIPPFLLTYYRGWRGASLGLAGGMAALTTANVVALATGLAVPDSRILFWLVATYIVVCVGLGLMGELLRRERAAAEAMALTDPLTGMPNRRHGSVVLDVAFASAVRGEPVTLVMIDLDDFKAVNDEHGHHAGDVVLRAFADALGAVTRRTDLSARWGGEEFLSILRNCDADGAGIFTGRLRSRFEEASFPFGKVTFSAGIAQYAPGTESWEGLVESADQALFEAKRAGRDRVRVAPPPRVESEGLPVRGGAGVLEPVALVDSKPEADARAVRFTGHEAEADLAPFRNFQFPRGDATILLADDDVEVRRALGRLLRRLGHRVVEAPDGESALASARSLETLEMLITDVVMPGMSGSVLAERMEEARGPLRVLYIPWNVDQEVDWSSAPGTAREVLEKPLGAAEVATTVRLLLDRSLPEP